MRAALYRLYRPQNFDEVEGQVHVATTLRNASKERHFAQAYLLTGTRGTGKTTLARIVAKAINCLAPLPDGNPCNVCEHCLAATQSRLVDIIEIDAASNNSVDQIRDLTERARFQPVQAASKVYIIDEVHMLSNSAANALLKTLEEPPAHVHFILATTEQHKILPTIISRCQVFHFLPLSDGEIVKRLTYVAGEEKIDITPEALQTVARHARGGMRDALSILERLASVPGTVDAKMVNDILGASASEHFEKLCDAIFASDATAALALLQDAQQEGAAADKFIRGFKQTLRDRLLQDAAKNGITLQVRRLMTVAERIEQSLVQVRYADIPWLHCELAILRACDSEAPVAVVAPVKAAPRSVPTPPPVPLKVSVPKEPVKERLPEARPDPVARLQKEWQSFAFKVPSAEVRTALKSTKVEGVEDGELTLVCQSAVQFAYLGEEKNLTEIRQALQTHYSIDMPVHVKLANQEAPITPILSSEPLPEPTPKLSVDEEIMKVADLFGGTLTS